MQLKHTLIYLMDEIYQGEEILPTTDFQIKHLGTEPGIIRVVGFLSAGNLAVGLSLGLGLVLTIQIIITGILVLVLSQIITIIKHGRDIVDSFP